MSLNDDRKPNDELGLIIFSHSSPQPHLRWRASHSLLARSPGRPHWRKRRHRADLGLSVWKREHSVDLLVRDLSTRPGFRNWLTCARLHTM